MAKLVALLAVLCACSGDKELQDKVDKLASTVDSLRRDQRDLETHVDRLTDQINDRNTSRKLDDLQRKLDQLQQQQLRPPPIQRPTRVEPDKSKTYAITLGDAPQEGPADAKVTIVDCYDYACPYCERTRETLSQLRQRYGSQLRIVHRPYVVHPQTATAAALAACAADRQHKFAAMDKLLWEKGFKERKFDSMSCVSTPDQCNVVWGFAKNIGLDMRRFQADMVACGASVQVGQGELTSFKVGATPTFWINGRFMSGAQPLDSFAALIDEELTKANARIQQGAKASTYYQQYVVALGEKRVDP